MRNLRAPSIGRNRSLLSTNIGTPRASNVSRRSGTFCIFEQTQSANWRLEHRSEQRVGIKRIPSLDQRLIYSSHRHTQHQCIYLVGSLVRKERYSVESKHSAPDVASGITSHSYVQSDHSCTRAKQYHGRSRTRDETAHSHRRSAPMADMLRQVEVSVQTQRSSRGRDWSWIRFCQQEFATFVPDIRYLGRSVGDPSIGPVGTLDSVQFSGRLSSSDRRSPRLFWCILLSNMHGQPGSFSGVDL